MIMKAMVNNDNNNGKNKNGDDKDNDDHDHDKQMAVCYDNFNNNDNDNYSDYWFDNDDTGISNWAMWNALFLQEELNTNFELIRIHWISWCNHVWHVFLFYLVPVDSIANVVCNWNI